MVAHWLVAVRLQYIRPSEETGPHVLPAKERAIDGARTRDLLRTTIRTHRFVVVRQGSEIRLNKPITRIVSSLMFADVRPGCRQNCRQSAMIYTSATPPLRRWSLCCLSRIRR